MQQFLVRYIESVEAAELFFSKTLKLHYLKRHFGSKYIL